MNNNILIITVLMHMLVAFLLFFLIIFLINKFLVKGKKKAFIIESIIGWIVVLIINIVCVNTNASFALGIPEARVLDAGGNKYYDSLGYVIHVYNPHPIRLVDDESPSEIETSFEFLHDYFNK